MKSFFQFITEASLVSSKVLKEVENYADKIFKSLNIDVVFTNHFKERINDYRNKKQITGNELIDIFKRLRYKHGMEISKLTPKAQRLIKDMKNDINIPFIIDYDKNKKMLTLNIKTIMRKKDFKSDTQVYMV
jgi:phenolic acid decarboxylase